MGVPFPNALVKLLGCSPVDNIDEIDIGYEASRANVAITSPVVASCSNSERSHSIPDPAASQIKYCSMAAMYSSRLIAAFEKNESVTIPNMP